MYWLLHLTCLFSVAPSTQPAGPASSNPEKGRMDAASMNGASSWCIRLLVHASLSRPQSPNLYEIILCQGFLSLHIAQDRFHLNSFWVIRSLLLGSFLFLFLPWSLVFVTCSRICCAFKITTIIATIIISILFCVVLWSFQNLWHIFPFIKNVE